MVELAAPPTPAAQRVEPRPLLAAWTLCQREWVRFIRQPNRVFGAIGQPIIFWLLFGAGLRQSFRMPGAADAGLSYGDYFFPGSLVLILLFTAIFATISIIEDRREGFLQSVLVAPLPRWSMVLGKIAGGTLIALVQGLIFLMLGLTVGVRFGPLVFIEVVVLLTLIALALTALGFSIAWRMDSTQGFHAIMSVFLLPMWLLSGAFFPVPRIQPDLGWTEWALAVLMRVNPLTYGVAELRRLLFGSTHSQSLVDNPSPVVCWIVTLAFAAGMFALAWWVSRQRTTGDLL